MVVNCHFMSDSIAESDGFNFRSKHGDLFLQRGFACISGRQLKVEVVYFVPIRTELIQRHVSILISINLLQHFWVGHYEVPTEAWVFAMTSPAWWAWTLTFGHDLQSGETAGSSLQLPGSQLCAAFRLQTTTLELKNAPVAKEADKKVPRWASHSLRRR